MAKYPAVRRDLSLLVDQQVTFDDLKTIAFKAEKKLIKQVQVFDVYQGDKVEKGKVVLILEAMKMENDIVAETSGTISKILVNEGSFVQAGSPMIEIV